MNYEELMACMNATAKELIANKTITHDTSYGELKTIFRQQISDDANDIFVAMFFNICTEELGEFYGN